MRWRARAYALQAKRVIDTIWNLGKPVIAAINGLVPRRRNGIRDGLRFEDGLRDG